MTSEADKQQEETDRVRVGDHALLYDLSRDEKRPTRHGRWVDLTLLPWIPYIWKGYRSHLEETSVPLNSAQDRTDFLAQQAKTLWHQEVVSKQAKPSFKTNKSKKKEAEKEGEGEEVGGSLISVMFKIQRFELACGLVCSLLQGLLFSVARPLLLGKIISIVSDPSSTTTEGVIFAVIFALVVLVEGVLQAQVKQLLSCRVGSRFIGWMSSLVHEKSTVVSAAAVADAGFQESALIGSDVTRMVEDWRWMCLLPYAIVALFGGIAILAYKLKMASLVGFGIMFSIAFFNYKITQAIKKVEEKDFAAGDLRISILREILAGIKAIKMMAWELPFRKLLEDARDEETRYIKQYRSYAVSSINFGRASPILAASFSILTLALTDPENLTAETIFVSIASFQGLRLPLISIPLQSTMLVNTLVSFKRIKRYLTLPNASPATPLDDASPDSVRVTDATFHWGKKRGESCTSSPSDTAEEAKQFCLKNISFHVKRNNNLVAVVGKVGSGKSSLISSILGSMQMEQGSFESVDNVAYIPQKAFVMSGTVTDNVLMGHPMNKTLFSRVLRASALDIDLEHLPDGINTEIGERGQTLSGGQAARVSIARALYHQPELLILDDPLSAVDPEVANNLFRRSVLGFLGRFGDLYAQDIQEGAVLQAEDAEVSKKSSPRRSVLMSLNQLHLLPYFDHIIVLHQGEIAEQGSFEELQERQDGVLVQMMQGLEAVEEEDLDVHLARDKKQEQQISEEQKQQPPRQDSHVESGPEEADQAASKEHHVLIAQEKGQKGAVSSSILVEYFRMQGLSRVPFSFLFAIGAYAFMASADLYLANWIKAASPDWTSSDHLARAGIYIVLSLLNVLGIETLSLHNTKSCFLASKNVHSTCMDHMLHAPITWYEETPSGRIISRFSGDLSMIDRQLAFIFDDTFQFIFLLLSLTIVVCYIVPELIAVVLLGVGLFVWQIIAVDRTNREVKRYANQALAPILTNVAETVGARDLIRCMHLESYFCQRHYAHVDRYTSNVYMSHSLVNFSTLMSGFISFLLSTGAALVVVFRRDAYDPSMVGLALTYSFLVPYFLGILSVIFPIGFAALTSLERILEYRSDQVPQEPAWYTEQDKLLIEMGVGPSIVVSEPVPSSFVLPEQQQQQQQKLAAKEEEGEEGASIQKAEHAWPSKGQIEFSNVSLVYRPGLAPAVKNLTVTFYGGQKHGICGRTGAGKSSITMLLFRVHECATGRVLIDGQDIRDIGLQLLRSSLTIIPQTPLLLSGNLRENLDPFKEYSDEKLRSVMEKVGLKPSLLEMEIVDDENSKENKKKSRSSKWASRIGSFKRALSSSTKYSAGKLKQIEAAGSASANTGKETTKGLSLSVGEKQLLSLARALLREESSRKIVVLDEPTSSLDVSSDDQIQRIVKREFRNATTLVIAHRLGSIIDSDRILVMDRGSLAEYGVPADLLKNENGHLFQMVSAMGDATSKILIEKANNSAANDQAVV